MRTRWLKRTTRSSRRLSLQCELERRSLFPSSQLTLSFSICFFVQWIRQPQDHLPQGSCSRRVGEARWRDSFHHRRAAGAERSWAEGERETRRARFVLVALPSTDLPFWTSFRSDGIPSDGTRLESIFRHRSRYVPSLVFHSRFQLDASSLSLPITQIFMSRESRIV